MTPKEYAEKNGATKFTIEFADDLNEGYTRRQSLVGAVLLKGFAVPNHDVLIDAYATVNGRIVLIENQDDVAKARFYDCASDLLENDAEAHNLKSAIAYQLDLDFVEEVEL